MLMQRKPLSALKRLMEIAVDSNFDAACAALWVLSAYSKRDKIATLLTRRLESRDASERQRAAFALNDLPHAHALAGLKKHAAGDRDKGVRVYCLQALRKLAEADHKLIPELAPVFRKAIAAKSPEIRIAGFQAAFSIPGIGDRARLVEKALHDRDPIVAKVFAADWSKNR